MVPTVLHNYCLSISKFCFPKYWLTQWLCYIGLVISIFYSWGICSFYSLIIVSRLHICWNCPTSKTYTQVSVKTVYIINCTGLNDNACDSTKDAYLALLMSSVDRLVATCDASATWCESKASQLLSAGSLAGFFLVTHSDLQVRQFVPSIYKRRSRDGTVFALSSCHAVHINSWSI